MKLFGAKNFDQIRMVITYFTIIIHTTNILITLKLVNILPKQIYHQQQPHCWIVRQVIIIMFNRQSLIMVYYHRNFLDPAAVYNRQLIKPYYVWPIQATILITVHLDNDVSLRCYSLLLSNFLSAGHQYSCWILWHYIGQN